MIIRLIRESVLPAASGPFHGQRLLQEALRRYGPAWLRIGGEPADGEIPWFWCWEDAEAACRWAAKGRPFVLGPNVLFHNSRRPCQFRHERLLCKAASCRLLFTESAWYRDLIAQHLGPANRAPMVLWPYPVMEAGISEIGDGRSKMGKTLTRNAKEPLPTVNRKLPSPNSDLPPPIFDLLVYAKSGYDEKLVQQLLNRYPRSKVLRYGHFRREELLHAARHARVCAYLSNDDRGPLALAEILTCGCPAVGMSRGAPWIEHGVNGAVVDALEFDRLAPAIALAMSVDRAAVAASARDRFSPRTVVRQIVEALETHVLFGF